MTGLMILGRICLKMMRASVPPAAPDDRVHPFAVVAGQAAQDHAHDAAYHGAGQSYNQGDAGAVQQTGENVAAQLVSAQQMAGHRVSAPDGVLQLDHDVLSQRVIRRQERGKDGTDDDEQHQDQPKHAGLAVLQAGPGAFKSFFH